MELSIRFIRSLNHKIDDKQPNHELKRECAPLYVKRIKLQTCETKHVKKESKIDEA